MITHRITTLSLLAGLAVGASACQQDADMNANNANDMQLRDGMAGISFRAGFPNVTPVGKVRYTFTPLANPDGEFIVEVDLKHNLALPGGLPEFNNQPLDKDSRHRFTDLFQKVEPGEYHVTVLPLGTNGLPLEECASARTFAPITAVAGMVTEEFLLMNCRGQDPAYLNVIAAINHEPELSVDFVRETKLTHSKFTCENQLDICLTAHDIDNDPLRFELVALNELCTVTETLAPAQNPPQVPCTPITQCYTVNCPGFVGKADLKARVYDQLWSGGTKIDIEQWLKGNNQVSGAPVESHAKLDFWGYYMDSEKCEPCPECDPPFRADFSYVLLQDLSESIKFDLPQIKNDVQDLVLNLKNDTTNLLNNECPLTDAPWEAGPNGGIASFIDRPKLPFGTPNDYVYRVERGSTTSPALPVELANTFRTLNTIDGADDSEAQLQALLAILGNYQTDTPNQSGVAPVGEFYLSTSSEGYLNFAIMITKSPYHASPDCGDADPAVKCTKPNENSPRMDENEEYPVMAQVAKALEDHQVFPIFLVVKDQGAFQTAPYQAIVDERGGRGLVVEYTPGVTDIRAKVAAYVKKQFGIIAGCPNI